jgi:hypothetical protein
MMTQVIFVALMTGLLCTCGCAAQRPDEFGRAVAEARTRQTENPGAGETLVPTEGLAPGTAEDVLHNYHRNQDTAVQEDRQERQRENGLVKLGH